MVVSRRLNLGHEGAIEQSGIYFEQDPVRDDAKPVPCKAQHVLSVERTADHGYTWRVHSFRLKSGTWLSYSVSDDRMPHLSNPWGDIDLSL